MKRPVVKILLVFIILFSIGFFSFQSSLAYELTKSVSNGLNNLAFRDITDLESTPNPTLSLDSTQYRIGDSAVLTLSDTIPNVDINGIDFAFAKVDGSSLTLTETDSNSGIFTGSFTVGSLFPTIEYARDFSNPNTTTNSSAIDTSAQFARMTGSIDVSNPGDVIIQDVRFSDDDLVGLCFRPVLHAVEIELADGATLGTEDSKITLSYANAVLLPDDDVKNLQMWYKKTGVGAWQLLTPTVFVDAIVNPSDPFSNDSVAKTITSDPAEAGFGTQVTTGQFTLGFDTGCSGGGGGGLVRPSLVINALAGIGSFGGGSAYSSPTLQLSNLVKLGQIEVPPEVEQMVLNHDSSIPVPAMDLGYFVNFTDFSFPLVIDDKGFVLSGYSTTIETQTVKTNTPHTFKFMYYEADKIQHFSLYTNLRGANDSIPESDTQILYFDGQDLKVIDPNGFFSSVNLNINQIDDLKNEIVLEIIFDKPMDKTDMILRSWDPQLNSFDTYVLDSFQVVPEEEIESPIATYDQPVIEQLTSQKIPIWVKNNAGWWSEQQIDDEDFVAGIEYLIKHGIINVPGVLVGSSSTSEVPDWVKNNAGWWSESLITDQDFIDAMEWLIENGVIQV